LQVPPKIGIDECTLANRQSEDNQKKHQRKDVSERESAAHQLSSFAALHDQKACANDDHDDGYHCDHVELHRIAPRLKVYRAVLL
jgi:hypothetical protein